MRKFNVDDLVAWGTAVDVFYEAFVNGAWQWLRLYTLNARIREFRAQDIIGSIEPMQLLRFLCDSDADVGRAVIRVIFADHCNDLLRGNCHFNWPPGNGAQFVTALQTADFSALVDFESVLYKAFAAGNGGYGYDHDTHAIQSIGRMARAMHDERLSVACLYACEDNRDGARRRIREAVSFG